MDGTPIQNIIDDVEESNININDTNDIDDDNIDTTNVNDISDVKDISDLKEVDIKEVNETTSYLYFIPKILREPLIFIIIFYIMSLSIITDSLANYLPRNEFLSIILYGTILYLLFKIVRKNILNE